MISDWQWHWDQGNKFAVEGLKVLLLLNGGAAVALMTFLGHLNQKGVTAAAGSALVVFGLGALSTTVAFACAYASQLQYGNDARGVEGARSKATFWHNLTYGAVIASGVLFLVGLLVAWCAMRDIT